MEITQNLQKWGNSTGIRLPKRVIEEAHLQPNQTVTIRLDSGSIILTPVNRDEDYTLQKMLEGVNPTNVHSELDWGVDGGAEQIDG